MTRSITVAIAGDVMLGRLVAEIIDERGSVYPWGDMLSQTRAADLFLINLECALTSQAERWRDRDGSEKAFYFRADPAAAATLQLADVDFASLANNHIADYGMDGLLETVRALDEANITHAGAGAELSSAQDPAYMTAGDCRIAVVAFADHPDVWAATPTAPGINLTRISLKPEHFGKVQQALTEARQNADLVIFTIHWGPNMRPRPTPLFRDFAHRVIEAGADVFWGHSAHVVQGIEIWQGKPILYDTGDFVDDYMVDPQLRNDLSALFLLQVRPPVVERLELIPVHIDHRRVNRAQGQERDWFAHRFAALCGELGTEVVASPERLVVTVTQPGPTSTRR